MVDEQIRVLLIEDDPEDALLIRGMLEEADEVSFECGHAESLLTGFDRLAEFEADIVLLDLGLPDATGMDTVVQTCQHVPRIPVVVLTGEHDPEAGVKAISHGAQDYLTKGQTPQSLLVRTLRYSLERHRMQTQLKEQADALRASESRLRSIVDKNVDAIVSVGRDGNLRFVTRAAETLFGHKAEEMIGEPFGLPIESDKIVECQIRQPSGDVRYVEMDVVDVDWDGEPVSLVSLRDVSERKEAVDLVLKRERELSLRNLISEVLLTAPDEEMYGEVLDSILGITGSEHGVFGYIREDGSLVCPSMTRDTCDQCQVPDKDVVFPRESWSGLWGRALLEKSIQCSNEPLSVPDGRLPIERAVALPLVDRDNVIGLLAVSNKSADYVDEDIEVLETIADHIAPVLNARLQRDQHARRGAAAQRDWEHIFRSIGHPTLILDRDRRVITANPALVHATGRPRSEIIGKSCHEICHGLDRPTDNCPLTRTIETRKPASAEVVCEGLGGTFLVSCSPMLDDDGQIDRIIHIAWNITKHKQAQEAIRQFQGEFSAARRVQRALLPEEDPTIPGFDLAGSYAPARFTAGDYYGYFPMLDGCLGVVVADVMGHGLGPALVTAEIRAYLRCLTRDDSSIEGLLSRLNRLVCADLPTGDFLTLFFGLFDPARRIFAYGSAGQPGFLIHPSGEYEILPATTLPLGIDEDAETPSAPPIVLTPGQIILLPTDGIYEAPSVDGVDFGKDRMVEVVHRHRDQDASSIVQALEAAVVDHLGGKDPPDDLTAVVVKVVEVTK